MKNNKNLNYENIRSTWLKVYFEISSWDNLKDEYYHESDDMITLADLLHALVNDFQRRADWTIGEYEYRYTYTLCYNNLKTATSWVISIEKLAAMFHQSISAKPFESSDLSHIVFPFCIHTSVTGFTLQGSIMADELCKWLKKYFIEPSLFQEVEEKDNEFTIADIPF